MSLLLAALLLAAVPNVALAGTIVIVKDAVPDDPQDFSFTDDIEEPGTFMLDDDADSALSNTRTFTGVADGSYSVSETVPAGWLFDEENSSCDDGNSSFDGETAFVNLEGGETVTCTFVNTQLSDVGFSKVFFPDTIGPGSTTTLTFSIDNSKSAALVTDIAFTDVLPAGIALADPSSAFTDCVDGVLSLGDNPDSISLSGARLGANTSCTVTVNVVGTSTATNVSGDLTSSEGSSGAAVATLTVDSGRPGFSKNFAPAVSPPGVESTLTFTIDNSANASDRTLLSFLDTLPAGLIVATPSNAATDCESTAGAATLTAGPGTSTISLLSSGTVTFPVLAAGATCTVTVDVTAASAGLFENVSDQLESDPGDLLSGFATAELDVRLGFLVKSFIDDPAVPGGTVALEFNINNPSRTEPATGIAFTDTIDPMGGLTGLVPSETLPKAVCDGTLGFASGVLSFTGGSLPAAGSCTFSVELAVPGAAAAGTYTNTTDAITATIDGSGVTGNMATDNLVVSRNPILTKEFIDDPVGSGGSVTLRFSIINTDPDSDLINLAFTDDLNTAIPGLAANGLVSGTSPSQVLMPLLDVCGTGSELTVESFAFPPSFLIADPTMLIFTGGSLAAGDTCTFDVTLDVPAGVPAGTYVNTTSDLTGMIDGGDLGPATNGDVPRSVAGGPVVGLPASGDLVIVGAPTLTKDFTDDPVQPGGTVTLQFTLSYPAEAPGDASGITFTDDLAALLPAVPGLVATGLPLVDLCGSGNGMLVGTASDTLLTFSGATLTPGQICTFSVTLSVPLSADSGDHTNTTSNVVATVLGEATTENPAEDDLMIGGLILTKEFTDDPVVAGGTVTLEFVITNQSPDQVTSIFFEDLLDPDVLSGLTVLDGRIEGGLPLPLPLNDVCGTGSLLEVFSVPATPATDEALRLTGGSLGPAGPLETDGVCTFSVTLMVPASTPSGTYPNRTRGFSAVIGDPPMNAEPSLGSVYVSGASFPNATDNLVVANEQLLLTKEFVDDPVVPGGTVTLEFGISTLGGFDSASDLEFTDDLDAALSGLFATGLPISACDGTLSTPDGGMTLQFSGGSFTQGDCGFSVTLEVPDAVAFGTTITNTTSEITGTIGTAPVTGEPASDNLMIDFFTFVKFFDGLTKPTGTPVLTFMITNLSTMASISDLEFTDNVDAVIPGLLATGLPAEPCGVGSQITGTSGLALSGGNLPPGGSCTFSVELLMPATAPAGSFLNTTSNLFQNGISVASPATALLEVDPAPLFGKTFLPDLIPQEGRSALSFLIDNSAGLFPVTGLAFTDTLPAGLVIPGSADVGTTCPSGTLTAVPGTNVISFSGGALPAGGSCLIQVDVSGSVPGEYLNVSGALTSSSGTSSTAIATLEIVDSGGMCLATNGNLETISDETFLTENEFAVCDTITVGPSVGVFGPDGHLILRAGVAVVFLNGVTIGVDGKLSVSIEPVLIP